MAESAAKNTRTLDPGGILFYEGDVGSEMYIVKTGKVEVVRTMGDGEVVLASLGPSQFFGEMALFGEPRRTAMVRAVTQTTLLVITKKMLESQFRQVPEWLVAMMKTVANRIISTGKGTRANFEISVEFSVLETLAFLLEEFGTAESKGKALNLDLVRQEIVNLLGIGVDELDGWLKKVDFVNLAKVKGSTNRLHVPDPERLDLFIKYLRARKKGQSLESVGIDKVSQTAFERIHKLLHR